MNNLFKEVIVVKNSAHRHKYRDKVDAFCRYCIFDSHADGSWRKQVENCTCHNCPLYDVRPMSIGGAK